MSDHNIDVSITGSPDGANAALNSVNSTVDITTKQMSDNVKKLSDNFGGVTGKLAAFGGAITAVEKIMGSVTSAIGKIVGASINMADEFGKQSRQLALTTEEWSAYQHGASLADIASGQLEQSIKKLNVNVADAAAGVGAGADAFNALGISVNNADGSLKSNSVIMDELADRFSKMPDSANKSALAIDLFGRSGTKMLTMLNDGSQGLQEFADEAGRMNMIVGPEAAAQSERFNDNLTKMNKSLAGMAMGFTSGILPPLVRFTDIINNPTLQTALGKIGSFLGDLAGVIMDVVVSAFELFFAVIESVIEVLSSLWDVVVMVADVVSSSVEAAFGENSISKLEFFTNVIKVIKLAFLGVGYAIEQMANGIAGFLEVTAKLVITFAITAQKALSLDFAGAKAAWRSGMDDINKIVEEKAAEIAKANEKYKDKATDIIFPEMKAGGKKSISDAEEKEDPITKTSDKTRTSDWAAELDATKQAYQLQNNLRELDIQAEISYWNRRLAQATVGSKEYAEVQKKLSDAKIRQMQVANQQAAELESIAIERSKSSAMAQLEIDQEQARAMLDIGRMSQDQYLAKLREFEDRRYAIALAGIEARIALAEADPNSNPATMAKLNAELEAVQQDHMKNKNSIDMEALRESNAVWEEISNSAASLWDKGLTSMMNGTLTWKNAMNAIWMEMGKLFVNFAAQKAKNWLATEVMQTVYSRIQILARMAMEKMGLAQSVASTGTAAVSKIGANAAVAGSGAASAMASIPYIGPILAIAAMAAMLASVGSLKGGVKSARGGFDIPAGLNPMTQLHEQEMVLPKEQAEAIRNMTGGGGGGGITLNVSAVDARSFRDLVIDNDKAIGDAVRKHIRNGGGNV